MPPPAPRHTPGAPIGLSRPRPAISVDTGAGESLAFPRSARRSRHPKEKNPMPDRTPRTSHRSRRITPAFAVAGAVVSTVLSLALAAGPAGAQTPGPQETLRIAQIEQVTNFDPALMSTQDMGVLIDNVYEGLLGTERDTTRLVPRLAEKWTLAPDGKAL